MKSIKFKLFDDNTTRYILLGTAFKKRMKHKSLPLIGIRKKTKWEYELESRISRKTHIKWVWFPFIDFMKITETNQKKFFYFSSDPLPLKCFIEYEYWKHRHGTFDTVSFLSYMTEKFNLPVDIIIEACNDFMTNLKDKSGKKYNEQSVT